MRHVFLLAVQLWSLAAFAAEPPMRAIFVGSFVNIDEVTCQDERRVKPGTKFPSLFTFAAEDGSEVLVTCHDRVFELTFRVETVLQGDIRVGERVKFFDHHPIHLPDIAMRQYSLLSVETNEDGRRDLVDWNEAYATSNGRFAQCGCKIALNRSDDEMLNADKECVHIQFKSAARSHDSSCRRGVEMSAIVEAWKDRDAKWEKSPPP